MLRRELRSERSTSERIFWEFVRKDRLGFHFRNGLSVGECVLDFYCAEASLCIELDGEVHEQRKERDVRRDAYLASRGIMVLRIPTLDLFEETGVMLSRWLREITRICEERSGRSAFDARAGGRLYKRAHDF